MSDYQNFERVNQASGAAVGFVFASLIFAVLAVIVKVLADTPPIDADREAVITKALMGIRTNEVASLETAGWIDRDRGIVRLPIQTAMQMTAKEWQDPSRARADLLARANKAAAPLPKQPVKPNPFE